MCEAFYATTDSVLDTDFDRVDDVADHISHLRKFPVGMSAEEATWSANAYEKMVVSRPVSNFFCSTCYVLHFYLSSCLYFHLFAVYQNPAGKLELPSRPPLNKNSSTPTFPYTPFNGGHMPGGRVCTASLDQLILLGGGVHTFDDLGILCGVNSPGFNSE